jgi:hypothetical protein
MQIPDDHPIWNKPPLFAKVLMTLQRLGATPSKMPDLHIVVSYSCWTEKGVTYTPHKQQIKRIVEWIILTNLLDEPKEAKTPLCDDFVTNPDLVTQDKTGNLQESEKALCDDFVTEIEPEKIDVKKIHEKNGDCDDFVTNENCATQEQSDNLRDRENGTCDDFVTENGHKTPPGILKTLDSKTRVFHAVKDFDVESSFPATVSLRSPVAPPLPSFSGKQPSKDQLVLGILPPPINPVNDKVRTIVRHYHSLISAKARLVDRARVKIEARLKTFSVEDLITGMQNFSRDSWSMKNNRHRGIEWFFWNDARSERYLHMIPRSEISERQFRCPEGHGPLKVTTKDNGDPIVRCPSCRCGWSPESDLLVPA